MKMVCATFKILSSNFIRDAWVSPTVLREYSSTEGGGGQLLKMMMMINWTAATAESLSYDA